MAISFHWKVAYMNEVEYEVTGHPTVKTIEAYSECRMGLLDYQRKIFNYKGEDFERNITARQKGVVIRYVDTPYNEKTYWAERRWTPEFYNAYVQHLKDTHAEYLVNRRERMAKYGWTDEEYPEQPMGDIPRPIYYDPEYKGYKTEPWYQPESEVQCVQAA